MAIPHFKRIFSNDYEINKLQSNAEEILTALTTAEFISGNILEVQLTTGDNFVEHKLSRKYAGWVVVDVDSASIIYRSSTTNNSPERQIILKASAPCLAQIYVF